MDECGSRFYGVGMAVSGCGNRLMVVVHLDIRPRPLGKNECCPMEQFPCRNKHTACGGMDDPWNDACPLAMQWLGGNVIQADRDCSTKQVLRRSFNENARYI